MATNTTANIDDLLLASALDIRADMDIVSAGGTLTAYDQSGFARDFSRAVATAPTLLASDPKLGGAPSLQFVTALSQRLTSTRAFPAGNTTWTFFVAAWVIDPDPTSLIHGGYIFDSQTGRIVITADPGVMANDGTWRNSNSGFEGAQILRFEFDTAAGAVRIYRNGSMLVTTAYVAKGIGTSHSIGSSYDGSAPYVTMNLNRLLIVPGILSPTRARAIERAMANRISCPESFVLTKTIGAVGDSVDAGNTASMTHAARLKQRLGLTGTAYSGAVSGDALANMIANPNTQLAGIPTSVDFLSIGGIINDLAASADPQTTLSRLAHYCRLVRQMGYAGKLIVMYPTPRDNGGAGYEANRQKLITMMAGLSNKPWDLDCRIDQDSRIGATGAEQSGTYYTAESGGTIHVHLNDTGQTVRANLAARDMYAAGYLS